MLTFPFLECPGRSFAFWLLAFWGSYLYSSQLSNAAILLKWYILFATILTPHIFDVAEHCYQNYVPTQALNNRICGCNNCSTFVWDGISFKDGLLGEAISYDSFRHHSITVAESGYFMNKGNQVACFFLFSYQNTSRIIIQIIPRLVNKQYSDTLLGSIEHDDATILVYTGPLEVGMSG